MKIASAQQSSTPPRRYDSTSNQPLTGRGSHERIHSLPKKERCVTQRSFCYHNKPCLVNDHVEGQACLYTFLFLHILKVIVIDVVFT